MSQIILDDQLFDLEVLVPIARWITVQRLRDLRPAEVAVRTSRRQEYGIYG